MNNLTDENIFKALIDAAKMRSLKEGTEIPMEDDGPVGIEPITQLPYAFREINKEDLAIIMHNAEQKRNEK